MFYIISSTYGIMDHLLTLFGCLRGSGLRHYELTDRLQTALVERAEREQRPAEELQEELLAAGLEHLKAADNAEAVLGSSFTHAKRSDRSHLSGIYQSPDGSPHGNLHNGR